MPTNFIPLRDIGPGSQPVEDVELQFLEMPRAMSTFEMPHVPEDAEAGAMAESREALVRLLEALRRWDPASGTPGPRVDLAGLSPAGVAVTNQVLGEGEVSVRLRDGGDLRIQESVFAGLWRVRAVDPEGRLEADWLEAGTVPVAVREAARAAPPPDFSRFVPPPGAMNSPALLGEIAAQCRAWRPGKPAHVINLSLLPLVPADHAALADALPPGPVAMLSRGFGNCHISSTGARHVWRVQYFNTMKTLILDSIEVIDVPEEAIASPEDLEDTRERLAELVDWMGATG